ncbi:MAG TPA: GNAT family N-acetyltransferase [Candidatus Dormibacteraeota bacterium]|nr:GNAT family N-acetyltransferase [Candidatus Dormibacteraeota bacterium]
MPRPGSSPTGTGCRWAGAPSLPAGTSRGSPARRWCELRRHGARPSSRCGPSPASTSPPAHRGQGVARALVRAAVDHARSAGARTIEAYPLDPGVRVVGVDAAYVGLLPLFADLGFQEVVRPWPARLVVRLRSG